MGGTTTLDVYLSRLVLAGLRPRTIQIKRIVLENFAETVPSLVHASREDIEAFLAGPYAPATRKAYASHFRAFYRYLVEEQVRADDPTMRLPRFRVPRGLPRPIAARDLALALEHADVQMRAWLLLMSLAGMRCLEVSGLRPHDLLLTDLGILLHVRETKGGGERMVPAHPEIVRTLNALPVRGGVWWRANPNSVSYVTGQYLRSLGIDATAHQLRHWAGTTWLAASGHDLLSVKALLGHATVSTVEVYAELDPRRPAEVVGLVKIPA